MLAAACRNQSAPAGSELTHTPRRPGDTAPASGIQRRMWLAEQLAGERTVYAVPSLTRLPTPLDLAALRTAWHWLTTRHPLLRTALVVNGDELRQRLDPTGPELDLIEPQTPLAAPTGPELPADGPAAGTDADTGLRQLVADLVAAPVDVGGRLVRATVVRPTGSDAFLVLVAHHTVCDGESVQVLTAQLLDAYHAFAAGRQPDSPQCRYDYLDYADWEAGQRPAEQAAVDARSRLLTGAALVLDLPTDRPRPLAARFRGQVHQVHVDPDLVEQLDAAARAYGVTTFVIVLAAMQYVLSRWTGQHDFVVGVAVRNRELPGTEGMIGPLADVAPVRARVPAQVPAGQLIELARAGLLAALATGNAPLDELTRRLQVRPDPSRHPVYQAVLSYQETDPTTAGPLSVPLPTAAARVDLAVNLTRSGRLLTGGVEYDADLFDPATVAEFDAQLRQALHALTVATLSSPVVAPPLAALVEQPLIGHHQPATTRPTRPTRPTRTDLARMVARQAEARPGDTAVEWSGGRLSYRELVRAADSLAATLREHGIAPGDVVAVRAERGAAVIVAMLAVLTAGATCLPVDPELPPARAATLLTLGRAELLLLSPGDDVAVPDGMRALRMADPAAADPGTTAADTRPGDGNRVGVDPGATAFLVFTSGSTGLPRPVAVPHTALATALHFLADQAPLPDDGGVVHRTSVAFDVAMAEIWWPLTSGRRLILAPPGAERDPHLLGRCAVDHAATAMFFVPTTLQPFLDAVPAGDVLRLLVTGGETLTGELAAATRRRFPAAQLVNCYGPAEAAVFVTWHPVPAGDATPPVGRPITGDRVYVLDPGLRPLPPRALGEVFLAGTSLASGYAHDPATTAARFLPDPFGPPGTRMYRTGDLGRWRPDGELCFAGRIDDQVKIGGVRIELGEVDAALAACPGVTAAASAVRTGHDGRPILVGYVCAEADVDLIELRNRLRTVLPAAAVPAVVVPLAALPYTQGGKVLRRELPAPPAGPAGPVEPGRGPVEELVILVWREVLGTAQIGRRDGFFELGGDSLAAARVAARLRRLLRIDLPVRAVLTADTPAGLARELIANQPRPDWAEQAAGTVLGLLNDHGDPGDPASHSETETTR